MLIDYFAYFNEDWLLKVFLNPYSLYLYPLKN